MLTTTLLFVIIAAGGVLALAILLGTSKPSKRRVPSEASDWPEFDWSDAPHHDDYDEPGPRPGDGGRS